MNALLKILALSALLVSLSHAKADTTENAEPSGSDNTSVVTKVENAIARGAKAAASGVEHGLHVAASGVQRGVKAAAHGVEKGAEATASAASHVANKVAGDSAPAKPGDK